MPRLLAPSVISTPGDSQGSDSSKAIMVSFVNGIKMCLITSLSFSLLNSMGMDCLFSHFPSSHLSRQEGGEIPSALLVLSISQKT